MDRRLALLSSLLSFACDPAIPPDYMGEPIGELHGEITSLFPNAPPPAEVILVWINWRSDPGTVVGTKMPVEGTFPAGFNMALHLPPPDNALNTLPEDQYAGTEEPRVGFAWILVMREGATPPGNVLAHADIKAVQPGDVLGWAEDYVYAYVDRDVPSGSWAEEIFAGTPSRGFHLMRATGKGGTDLEAIRDCKSAGQASSACAPVIEPLAPPPDGNQTEVPIRLTPDLFLLRLPIFALPDLVEEAFGIAGGGS